MWAPSKEESYFASMDYTKNVVNIMPSVEMMVTFSGEREVMRTKKACLLYAEKIDFKELIVSCKIKNIISKFKENINHSNCDWPKNVINDACILQLLTVHPFMS